MSGSEINREARRGSGRVAKAALVGATAAALTAGLATAGLASAPSADAAIQIYVDRDYTWDPVYSSGLVAGLLDVVSKLKPGLDAQLSDTISFHSGPPPALGLTVATAVPISVANANLNVALNLNLRRIAGSTRNLYNTEAGIPQPGCANAGASTLSGGAYATKCRYAIQLATLGTEFNLLDAYRGQIASVQGDTPAGLIPFLSSADSTAALPTWTNQALIVLQNPDRPNGGLAARFPGISMALGLNPVMPGAGKVTSPDGKTVLNTTTLDLTWAYDPVGDFPAVFNLPAITNSIAAALPLNIVTGGLAAEPLQGSSLADIGLNLASVLQLPLDVNYVITIKTLAMEAGQAFYSTLVPNELPITAAMGLPSTVANFALNAFGSKFLLGNPLGEALAPAMKILVNTGYTDVLTPDRLTTCATGCGTGSAQTWAQLGYTAYDRTFGANAAAGSAANAATPTAFNSVEILTPEEEAQKKLDVKAALAAGLAEQKAKPFWGFIVPNPAKAGAAVKSAAVAARTAAPVVTAVPAADPAPAIEAPAPIAVTSVAAPSAAPVAAVAPAKPARSKSDNSTGGAKAAASAPKVRATR